MIPDKILLVYV